MPMVVAALAFSCATAVAAVSVKATIAARSNFIVFLISFFFAICSSNTCFLYVLYWLRFRIAALPELRASRGTLIAVSSMMARLPLPAFSSYTASKHALRGFLNTLAVEEREQGTGVRIAMIEPGPLDTPIYGRATSATGRSPARLFDAYHPDEIAKAVERALDRPRREHVVGGESKLMTAALRERAPGRGARVAVRRPLVPPRRRAHLRAGQPVGGQRSGPDRRRAPRPPQRRRVASPGNMLRAGRRAVALGPALLRPVPEEAQESPVACRADDPGHRPRRVDGAGAPRGRSCAGAQALAAAARRDRRRPAPARSRRRSRGCG